MGQLLQLNNTKGMDVGESHSLPSSLMLTYSLDIHQPMIADLKHKTWEAIQ